MRDAFSAPSGRTLQDWDYRLWCELENNGSFGWNDGEITFNQGFRSHIYLQGRNDLSDNPQLLRWVAGTLYALAEKVPITHGSQKCFIGIPTAGTQLAQMIAYVSFGRVGRNYCFRTMRTERKTHGKDTMWIGTANCAKHSYVTVENVCSTGKSMLKAFERMESEGYPVREMHHLVFADWELGGFENLTNAGFMNVHRRYIVRDIVALFVRKKRWPKERWEYIDSKLATYRT